MSQHLKKKRFYTYEHLYIVSIQNIKSKMNIVATRIQLLAQALQNCEYKTSNYWVKNS